jgi:hypothetical protein
MVHEGWDPHLRGALILVAYMAMGAVLGVLSRRLKLWGTVVLCAVVIASAVVWNSWRYVDPRFGLSGLVTTLTEGFVYYTAAFGSLLLVPLACTRLALDYLGRRAAAERKALGISRD